MSANKQQIIGSITRLMANKKNQKISPFSLEDRVFNKVGLDDDELGLKSTDNTWFIPLTELTNTELKMVKTKIKSMMSNENEQ